MARYYGNDSSSDSEVYESDSDYISSYEQYFITQLACHLAEKAPPPKDVGKSHFEIMQQIEAESVAYKNAAALILEEECNKATVESRKEKPKKKHKKKKGAKQQQETLPKKMDKSKSKPNDSHDSTENDSGPGDEEEVFGPHNAFVSGTAVKNLSTKSVHKQPKSEKQQQNQTPISLTSVQEKAYSWAQLGNLKANQDKFEEAIQNYTKAIKLQPNDYRFYGNRSFCYEKINNYEKALEDATNAIQIEKKWPKNYFRKGLALIGLKKYEEAEVVFNDLLALDNDCNEAREILFSLRVTQLKEMGFSEEQAYFASVKYDTVVSAVEGLVCGLVPVDMFDDIFVSDDEDQLFYASVQTQPPADCKIVQSQPTDNSSSNGTVTKPSLWVGNIFIGVEEGEIKRLFSRFGDILSVHCLTDNIIGNKYCAFVNFKDKVSAAKAMSSLQGYSWHGHNLDIKYPNDNQNSKKTNPIKSSNSGTKLSGNPVVPIPVNGECYYWRKFGVCRHDDDKCRYKHVKDHKGIDKSKPG